MGAFTRCNMSSTHSAMCQSIETEKKILIKKKLCEGCLFGMSFIKGTKQIEIVQRIKISLFIFFVSFFDQISCVNDSLPFFVEG